MIATWAGPLGRGGRIALLAAALAACAALAQPVDVAPGQRLVVGRIDLSGLEETEGIVDVVRQDGAFSRELAIGPGTAEFALGMPPGHYRIITFRGAKSGRTLSDQFIRYLNVSFDVGDDPAVYIGTLRVTSGFGPKAQVTVIDEMERTLRVLRSRYSDLPAAPARALMTPG
jgi:hypothetical protein